jgi:hypothetical protein
MKVGEMRRFYRLVPREFGLAMLTLLGVIVLDVLPALARDAIEQAAVSPAEPSVPLCSSWTATTRSTSPPPSNSRSWPTA